jgi:predicted dehydrogenase
MKPVRTALIGCGKVGGLHAGALTTRPESTLVAVCDSNAERAGRFAARYGGRAFRDVPQMIREAGAEAVFVCTPHPLHAEPAVLAAQAGLHVMVEKPMAASLSDCDAMLRAAEKSG